MISIIMPAYNEAAVIAGTLASLIDQDTDIPFEVIVIANGCDDDTADRARAMAAQMAVPGRSLRVIETDRRGKTNAFNLGDAQARYGARIYMDGDLRVSNNLVACSAPLLADETACYLGYRLETAPSRSFITSAYGRMWSRSPLLASLPHGIAFCGMNAAGRARWGTFPSIIADDYFMRLHFRPDERHRIDAVHYRFPLADGLDDLLAVRARWARGHEEVARAFPHLLANEDQGRRFAGFWKAALAHPVDAGIFAFVHAYGRIAGPRKLHMGDRLWERAPRQGAAD